MFAVIVIAGRFVVRRFAVAPSTSARLGTGLLALGLMLAAELMLAVVLQDRSPPSCRSSWGEPRDSGVVTREAPAPVSPFP